MASEFAVQGFINWGLALVSWSAVLYKVPPLLRHPGSAASRAFALALVCVAIALTMSVPVVNEGLAWLTGVANIALLLNHMIAVVGGWSTLRFLGCLAESENVSYKGLRTDLSTMLATLLGIGVFFALTPSVPTPHGMIEQYGAQPFVFEHHLVFLSYMSLMMYNVTRLSRRYARIMIHRPATHLGMNLVATVGYLCPSYITLQLSHALTRRMDIPHPLADPELATDILKGILMTILITGATMPAWGTHVGIPTIYMWLRQYRMLRRLRPLWLDLYQATPAIALIPPSSEIAEVLQARDVGFRLYRRAIEIWDGYVALRPYLDLRVAEEAARRAWEAGLNPEETELTTRAACLKVAVGAKRRSRMPQVTASNDPVLEIRGFDVELGYLDRLASYYECSAIVREVASKFNHTET